MSTMPVNHRKQSGFSLLQKFHFIAKCSLIKKKIKEIQPLRKLDKLNFFVFLQVKRMKDFFGLAGRFAGRRIAARDGKIVIF